MPSVAKRQAPPWLEQSLRQAASLAGVPGLPADAVLCVRRLPARLDTQGLRHAGGLLGAAQQLSRLLQMHAAEARRPAREIVPESAAAVLFDSPAQMLACAARDWLDGLLSSHWWWRNLVDRGALAKGAIPLWRLHAIHIPAALTELNTRAEEFCRRIAVADAQALVGRLIEYHALPSCSEAHTDWLPRLPELAPDDPRWQLLALGLSLANAPALGRRSLAKIAPAVSDVPTVPPDAVGPKARQRVLPGPDGITESDPALYRENETEARTDEMGARQTRSAIGFFEQREPIQPTGGLSPQPPKSPPQLTGLDSDATPISTADDRQTDRSSPESRQKTTARTPHPHSEVFSQTSTATRPITPPPTPFAHPGEWIETRYGGVLYLLNVAIHLGFYPDFTQPRDSGLALSPWAFLALIGERLVGRRLRHDALWILLATLTGTDADQPVFTPETNPPLSLPEAVESYRHTGEGRYPVSESNRRLDPGLRRGDEFKHHRASSIRTRKLNASTLPDTWAAWIDQLIAPLRRRLAAALGVPPRQVGRLLCCQSAHVRLRARRLDAHFDLNDHPVTIRLSGLDRDPGWMPSAGRDIRFFYDRKGDNSSGA